MAQAVAIADGKNVFVGTDADVQPNMDSGIVVMDLNGKMVLPGFVDAHAHLSQAMDAVDTISLYGADSLEAYQAAITDYVEKHSDRKSFAGAAGSVSTGCLLALSVGSLLVIAEKIVGQIGGTERIDKSLARLSLDWIHYYLQSNLDFTPIFRFQFDQNFPNLR